MAISCVPSYNDPTFPARGHTPVGEVVCLRSWGVGRAAAELGPCVEQASEDERRVQCRSPAHEPGQSGSVASFLTAIALNH